MENVWLWMVQLLVGVILALGGIVLNSIRNDIKGVDGDVKELDKKVENHKAKLDLVIIPNVGVGMCNKVQETNKEVFKYFGEQCDKLDKRGLENREALIKFDGKLDLIIAEVKGTANRHRNDAG